MSIRIFITNAFSLSMLNPAVQLSGEPRIPFPIGHPNFMIEKWKECAKEMGTEIEIISAVGHADTAALFSEILGREIAPNRIAISLQGEFDDSMRDRIIIGQVMKIDGGPYRLPAGCTELPDDATIAWWTI